jgi:molybdopterin-guanine dinucleotide biosynthesis protein A
VTLAALILAGGLSQRMGQDKALLEKDGVPLIRRTWEVAHALTPDVWIVTPRRDRYSPLLPTSAQWIAEAPPLPDASPAGPLVAFAHALHHIEADWVLLLACDLPNLDADMLAQWRQDLARLPEGAIAYLPRTPEGWDPLCGFYRTACLPSLQDYVTTGKRSFQRWLDQASVVPIDDVPVKMLVNCNTPQDWGQLQTD